MAKQPMTTAEQIEIKQKLLKKWVELQEHYFNAGLLEEAEEAQSYINQISFDIAVIRRAEDRRK